MLVAVFITEAVLRSQLPNAEDLTTLKVKLNDVKISADKTTFTFEAANEQKHIYIDGDIKKLVSAHFNDNKAHLEADSCFISLSEKHPGVLLGLEIENQFVFGLQDYEFSQDLKTKPFISFGKVFLTMLLIVNLAKQFYKIKESKIRHKIKRQILAYKNAWELGKDEYQLKIDGFTVYVNHIIYFDVPISEEYEGGRDNKNYFEIYIQVPEEIVEHNWVWLRSNYKTEAEDGITYVPLTHKPLLGMLNFDDALKKIRETLAELKEGIIEE
ncbi:MAG: hypothetical protein KDC92_04895 [Bacteroidetes bacterium]|nr:hypothetical protein [Bacteroidota bacterium]